MRDALVRLAPALPLGAVATSAALGGPRSLTLVAAGAGLAIGIALVQAARTRRRLATVAAVLAAYRDRDLAIRARQGVAGLAEVVTELNALGEVLRSQRLGELEAWTLLRKVLAEVDVIVLAVDDRGTLRLANDAATRVLGEALVGTTLAAHGLAELVTGEAPRTVELGGGELELRRGSFRLAGEPQTLLVLSDVSRMLRARERDAWQRLVRVMGHEINNSLSPIASIASSLRERLAPEKRDAEWEEDLASGLGVIGRRAEALGRFMSGYARLARLPAPRRAPVDLRALVQKLAALETRADVTVRPGPDLALEADADQLEQALLNLVKNAAEASLAAGRRAVRLGWRAEERGVVLTIDDDGRGVGDTTNLFVPFFTTKPEGSGIGLALARQIVEAHGGALTLETRAEGGGARAEVRLPLR